MDVWNTSDFYILILAKCFLAQDVLYICCYKYLIQVL